MGPSRFLVSWTVYADVLAKYGCGTMDFIAVQFYESYYHGAHHIYHQNMKPSDFLIQYVSHLVANNNGDDDEGYRVNFQDGDASANLGNQVLVHLPISEKLVFGFANGWAKKFRYARKGGFYSTLRNQDCLPRVAPERPCSAWIHVLGD